MKKSHRDTRYFLLTIFDIDVVEMQRNKRKNLGMKNRFDLSDSIEICEFDIAGVACIQMKRLNPHLIPSQDPFIYGKLD